MVTCTFYSRQNKQEQEPKGNVLSNGLGEKVY